MSESNAEVSMPANSNFSAEVPSTPGYAEPAPVADIKSLIPAEYAEKPYVQTLLASENPQVEFFKQFDSLQEMLGKRPPTVPAADAPQEDWNKYFETTRPEAPDKYEIPSVNLGEDKKHIAELMNEGRTDEFLGQAKSLLHKWGLQKNQAEGLIKDYDAMMAKVYEGEFKKAEEGQAKLESEWQSLLTQSFGGDAEKAVKTGRELLHNTIPDNLKPFLEGLPNEHLMIMLASMNHVYKTKFKEDNFLGANARASGSGDSLAELQKLMVSKEYRDQFHPNHINTRKKVEELAGRINTK